jgi:Ca-activated chloride channel family protein
MSTAVDGNRRLPEGNNPGVSRLDHARRSLEHFVAKRTNDFLGLVAFARIPERRCPLTLDHPFLIDAARGIQPAAPGDDGTNMGDAIAWSIEELRSVQAARRVVVLLSDGRNEPGIPGALEPIEAARLARSMGAILHTIAIGGGSPSGAAASNATNGPDFELLAEMARAGGGRMFVAADPESLESAFLAIDELEPNPIRGEVFSRYHEQRPLLAAAAFVILLLSLGWAAIRPPSLP